MRNLYSTALLNVKYTLFLAILSQFWKSVLLFIYSGLKESRYNAQRKLDVFHQSFKRPTCQPSSCIRNQKNISLNYHKLVQSYQKLGRTLYQRIYTNFQQLFVIRDRNERKFKLTPFRTSSKAIRLRFL